MAENGEDKLIAVARHIAKTLGGHTDNMTDDDILKIFSNFDCRLREKLTDSLPGEGDDDIPRAAPGGGVGSAKFEQTVKSLGRQISVYVSADHPIWSDSADANSFLDVVDELTAAISLWTPFAHDKQVASCLDRAEEFMQKAMFRLEEEFKALMDQGTESFDLTRLRGGEAANPSYSSESDVDEFPDEGSEIPVAHPISDYDIIIDALPAGIIDDLHEIAKRMVEAGYGKECSHAYSMCRREFLEESFSRLQLQKFSIDEIHKMQWTEIEDEIDKWVKGINVALRILFPSERRLCDRVFFGFSSAADLSFMEVVRGSTIQLLNFADAVAIGSRAPERLFKVLDVYETIRDLMPEFELIFSDQHCVLLRNEAVTIWKRLGEAIRGIFMELENLIRRDPAKAAVPGGGLHPITRYVMNYLRAACRSRITLEQVFEDTVAPPGSRNGDYMKGDERGLSSSSPLAVQMAWSMELLETNLEAKSKVYRDSALSSVFMMNNGRYIVQKVRDNELGSLLGDDWIRKHTAKVRQYHVNYQRSSWSKVLGVLRIDNSALSPNGTPKSMKEKLKLFNTYFEETCRTQSNWVVFDEQLRDELRISVAGNLSPAYRNFIGRFQSSPESGKHADKYIKYSVEDLEARINQLFCGSGGSSAGRK
ncbi:OLC1v1006363C1 [Oldenlandia corymbosa var. corymbosa]|uniref:Exocyst subunit Exo70 family protein n=1 Tax=Oldenlandia corymbosa var. corymbosa TaxID=529605 RepID=A0AAV1DGT6_OLDCO|nr:OLC1v1006363C1 [Oldenlandia corymbosa var. corymbosa]